MEVAEDLRPYTIASVQNILPPLKILIQQHRVLSRAPSKDVSEDDLFTMIDSVSVLLQAIHGRTDELAKRFGVGEASILT